MAGEDLERLVHIEAGIEAGSSVTLEGALAVPEAGRGMVLFAHGSGSSRHSPRNNYVARVLQADGLGTLLIDLLTAEEDRIYQSRFDIDLLTRRLMTATRWLKEQPLTRGLHVGYFGASTGAAAALKAAAALGREIEAVVSRGGRPDLAEPDLAGVQAPTLLIVGGDDEIVIKLNQRAYDRIPAVKQLVIVPGATHLFEEPGKLETVASMASLWFKKYLLQE